MFRESFGEIPHTNNDSLESGQETDPEKTEKKFEIIEDRRNKTATLLGKILENPLLGKIGKIPGPNVLWGTLELALNKKPDGQALSGREKIVRVIEAATLAFVAADLALKYSGIDNSALDIGALGAKGMSWLTFTIDKIGPKLQELGAKDFTLLQLAAAAENFKHSKDILFAVAEGIKKYSPDLFDYDFIKLNLKNG